MNRSPLRLLIVEDNPDDADLMIRQLRIEGFEPEWQRVQNPAEFLAALESPCDLILADYSLPQFSGLAALQLLQEHALDVPLILISGTIGEEIAVNAIKLGAYDYLLKGNLTRLGPAIRNALQDRALREQNRASEQALRASEIRFRRLIENAPDAISLLDDTGRLTYASPSTERVLGYKPQEVIGANPADATHPDDLGNLLTLLADLIENPGKVITTQYRFKHKDGSWRWLESTLMNLLGEPGIQAIVFNYRDISERKHAEDALQQAEQKYRTLVEQLPAITYLDDVREDALRQGEFFNTYLSPQVEQLLGYPATDFYSDPGLWVKLIHPDDRQRAIERNIEHFATRQPYKDEYRMLRRDGHVVWVRDEAVAVKGKEDEPWLSQGVIFDITERKQHERELEAIAAVSSALRSAANRAGMLPIILDQLIALLNVEGAALAMRDPVSGETVIEIARGEKWSRDIGLRIPAGEGITSQVIDSSQMYVNNDMLADPEIVIPASGEKLPAAACAPLIAQGQSIGAIWIGSHQPIDSSKVHLLTAISNIAASAIHRATLFEQTQRRLKQISALHSIDIAISSSFDLRFTLNILLEQVTSHLEVDATDILLLNPHSQILEFVAGRGFISSGVERLRVRLGDGQAGRAALERRTVSIPNLQSDENRLGRSELLAAENFVSYYGVPLIAKGQVKGLLEIFHRSPLNPDPDWLSFLETLADQAAIAINDAAMFDNLQRSNTELVLAYDATIEGWSRALDLRDNETEGHTQRVTEATLMLARSMRLSDSELIHIRRGALLHDIGKMGIPDAILLKPGQLTEQEWLIMRKHPVYAYDLLRPIEFLRQSLDIPYCHHEKWDGTGYPRGLKGANIPLAARIFSVADVWDALCSDRPYRTAWSREKTRAYIEAERGTHFDPEIVQIFLKMKDSEPPD
jgi:PAS domain S-box-containing protein